MGLVALFPHWAGLRLVRVERLPDELLVEAAARATTARCPVCRRRSHRVHSLFWLLCPSTPMSRHNRAERPDERGRMSEVA